MILYFSGTGNSAYVANRIGQALQDEVIDLFNKIRMNDVSELQSDRAWVIVAPTYAWRIPRILRDWLKESKLQGNRDIYFVMTCGGNISNAGIYNEKLCSSIGMKYRGTIPILMPENYIALFNAPSQVEALEIIARAEKDIDHAAEIINNKRSYTQTSITLMDRLNSGIINDVFYPAIVHAKKFYVTQGCISCGKCVAECPLQNIELQNGMPVWGNNCTHCMSCICKCPKEAIEYGKKSKGKPRYTCPK